MKLVLSSPPDNKKNARTLESSIYNTFSNLELWNNLTLYWSWLLLITLNPLRIFTSQLNTAGRKILGFRDPGHMVMSLLKVVGLNLMLKKHLNLLMTNYCNYPAMNLYKLLESKKNGTLWIINLVTKVRDPVYGFMVHPELGRLELATNSIPIWSHWANGGMVTKVKKSFW